MPEYSHPILFECYPGLKDKIPFVPLGRFPTPVRKLTNLGDGNLWIKQDDLDSDTYSGNKVRKLEFILADVIRQKKKRIITLGGCGTNHGLATGIYAASLGLECRLLTFRQPVTAFVKKNMRLFGRHVTEVAYSRSVWGAVMAYYITERLRNPRAYFLYAGGSNAVGTIGFVNAAFELKRQIDAGEMPEPAYIFCPLGSNGTAAGLALGCVLAGLTSKVMAVNVTFTHLGPFASATERTVLSLMKKTYRYLKRRCPALPPVNHWEAPRIIGNYVGDGYGCPTEDCRKAMILAAERERVILDPTYTAKTFSAFLDYAAMPAFAQKPLLYWHTYNAVDLSRECAAIADGDVPACLQNLMKEEEVPL